MIWHNVAKHSSNECFNAVGLSFKSIAQAKANDPSINIILFVSSMYDKGSNKLKVNIQQYISQRIHRQHETAKSFIPPKTDITKNHTNNRYDKFSAIRCGLYSIIYNYSSSSGSGLSRPPGITLPYWLIGDLIITLLYFN